eukprot:3544476-Pyramimonas_sp.AAC.1
MMMTTTSTNTNTNTTTTTTTTTAAQSCGDQVELERAQSARSILCERQPGGPRASPQTRGTQSTCKAHSPPRLLWWASRSPKMAPLRMCSTRTLARAKRERGYSRAHSDVSWRGHIDRVPHQKDVASSKGKHEE